MITFTPIAICCRMAESRHRPLPVTDPRKFLFALQCRYCLTKYNTLQQAKQHFTDECDSLPAVKIRCECCSTTFRHWGECAVHLNVKGAHLRKRSKVVVVSTTSSSEGEATPIKAETRPDIPTVARQEVNSPARQPSPVLVESTTPPLPVLSASQADLSVPEVEAAVRSEGVFVNVLTSTVTSPTLSATYAASIQPTLPATPAQLPIGPSATITNVWRHRYYALAHHTRFWVNQIAQAGVETPPSGEQLAARWTFGLDWPPGTDSTLPLSPLADSLMTYYEQLADADCEPDIGAY